MPVFTITSKNSIDQQIIDNGYFSVTYQVAGYWSRDTIRVDGRRKSKAEWNIEVTHGFGGFDQNSCWTQIDAMRNFANTLLAAIELARELQGNIKRLNGCYDRHIVLITARFEAEQAEKKAKIAKELAIIEAKAAQEMEWTNDRTDAEQILGRIERFARSSYIKHYVAFRKAGHDFVESITCNETSNGRVSFTHNGRRIAKQKALLMLEGSIVTAQSV